MNTFPSLLVGFTIHGAFWRGAFVAGLAIIAFVLARYWKSLSRQSNRTRAFLVGLRGLSFLLLVSALAGVGIEYETHSPLRLLIHQPDTHETKDDNKHREAIAKVVASLKTSDVEVIEKPAQDESNGGFEQSLSNAAIVLTDGAMGSEEARREIERVNSAIGGGPVFVVTDFQTDPGPRVALNSVAVMTRPVRGVPLLVRCLVHARGMRGRTTLVTLSDDAQVRVSAQVQWKGDDERQVVNLEVTPKVSGWVNYLVRAEPAGSEDQTTLSRPLTIYSDERRQRILVLEGEPTWEAKFIRRVLEKPDLFDVDYFAQVSRAAMVGARDEQAANNTDTTKPKQSAEPGAPEARLHEVLSSTARLNNYDCIIIGETPDGLLSIAEAARVREWVERRGGGVIVLGGNNFAGSIVAQKGKLGSLMPAEIVSSSFRSDSQTLAVNTPVQAEKSRGNIVLTPTDAGQNGALHGYSVATEGNTNTATLSGDGLRLGQLRAGATVLAVKGQDGAPLVATMRYGAGRTLVFAPSDSWRMRASEAGDQADNDGPFSALWQGMTLWAASGSRPPIEIVMSDDSPETGIEATAEIRVRDETFNPVPIEKLNGRLQQLTETTDDSSRPDAPSIEIPFAPSTSDPSIWRAQFVAPPVGRFILQVKYTSKGKSGTVDKYFATVKRSSVEKDAGRDTLQRVARETGGDLFTASNISYLKNRLAALPKTSNNLHRRQDLRSWWPLSFIIPLLLSCEWLILRMKTSTGPAEPRFAAT